MWASIVVAAYPSAWADELMPPHVAAQLGLEEAWMRHVYVAAGAQSIVDQQIVVHEADPHEYVEIVKGEKNAEGVAQPTIQVLSRVLIEASESDQKDAALVEAKRVANNEVRRLKRRGIDASTRTTAVRRVYLYTLSNDGTLDCRNAETGQPVWRSSVGDPGLSYAKMGVDDKYLSLVNGANLVTVDVATGEEILSSETNNVPLYGSINSGDYALVPTIRNGVEGYSLSDPAQYPFSRMVDGMALAPPSKAPGTTRVVWGTNRGFVYAMELSGEPSVMFRLDTDGIVSASPVGVNGDRFFFGSENGQVYGLHATRTGKVLWSRPYADPFYKAPIVYGDRVFISSTYGNLFALGIEDGFMTWPDSIANVDELIAAFDNKLFVRLMSGHLSVIDIEKGKTLQTFFELLPRHFVVNVHTDRLYLLSENGTVQCLRPRAADLPTLNELMLPIPGQASDEEAMEGDPEKDLDSPAEPMVPAGEDPFAPAADPFAPTADPFGAGADDPFAPIGGDDAAMDDPFGGDDPFN